MINLRSSVLYVCLAFSIGLLGVGYILAGYWFIVPAVLVMTLFWMLTKKRSVFWASSSLLSAHVILAAIGIASGFSSLLMITSSISALICWDLVQFDHRMARYQLPKTNASQEKAHLELLALAAATGLLLAFVVSHINLQEPFGVIAILVLLTVGCLIYGFKFITRKNF